MFCPNCGKEVEEGVTYCPNCGHALSSASKKQKEASSENGIIAVSCGVLSIILPYLNLILGILGIYFGNKSKDSDLGRAGKITGIIGLVLSILEILVTILLFVLLALSIIELPKNLPAAYY